MVVTGGCELKTWVGAENVELAHERELFRREFLTWLLGVLKIRGVEVLVLSGKSGLPDVVFGLGGVGCAAWVRESEDVMTPEDRMKRDKMSQGWVCRVLGDKRVALRWLEGLDKAVWDKSVKNLSGMV